MPGSNAMARQVDRCAALHSLTVIVTVAVTIAICPSSDLVSTHCVHLIGMQHSNSLIRSPSTRVGSLLLLCCWIAPLLLLFGSVGLAACDWCGACVECVEQRSS